jgi:hypothetical protein
MYRFSYIIGLCLIARVMPADDSRPQSLPPANPSWPKVANFIDENVFGELRELNVVPSPLCSDTEFLRRLSLTTIGQLPTAAEVRIFVADKQPDKRTRKIEELLRHKLHAAVWANRLSEMTGNSIEILEGPDELKPKRAKMWHDWLRRRIETNVPYDKIVRDILTATSRSDSPIDEWIDSETALVLSARQGFDASYADRPTLDLFWRRGAADKAYPVEEIAERVASNFMGVRINCARCHKHPFDHWTQDDYRAFVSIFSEVRFDMSPELRANYADRLEKRRELVLAGKDAGPPLPALREVYLAVERHDSTDNDAARMPTPKALGGPILAESVENQTHRGTAFDARAAFVNWLSEPQNPYFARNIVNRVWAYYFGRGLIEPLDALSATNPPSNPKLLDALVADFIQHKYDLRRLEHLILNSTTWQLSSEPNETNVKDHNHFARAYMRVPPAETVIDMWHDAVGISVEFGEDVPKGIHAVEIGPSGLRDKRWDRLLKLFGRSARTLTCDCEPPQGPSIRQTLALMSDSGLMSDISKGRLKALLETKLSDEEILDELFLSTVSRWPTADERSTAMQTRPAPAERTQFFEDILWGLVNTQEFITNH